jgi:hypothetical protein
VAISLGIAVVASIAALWLVFNTTRLWQVVASALVMGLAVCGMSPADARDGGAPPPPAGPSGIAGVPVDLRLDENDVEVGLAQAGTV